MLFRSYIYIYYIYIYTAALSRGARLAVRLSPIDRWQIAPSQLAIFSSECAAQGVEDAARALGANGPKGDKPDRRP